jgi:hypothetical protein
VPSVSALPITSSTPPSTMVRKRGLRRISVKAQERDPDRKRVRAIDQHLVAAEIHGRAGERAASGCHPQPGEDREQHEIDVRRDHPKPADEVEPRDRQHGHGQ